MSTWKLLLPCALLGLGISLSAQPAQTSENAKPAEKDSKTMTVTGCLSHGGAKHEKQYVLTSGEMAYPLEAAGADLKAHVGHKVTISGMSLKGQGPHDDDRIRVTKLTMVSAMCP